MIRAHFTESSLFIPQICSILLDDFSALYHFHFHNRNFLNKTRFPLRFTIFNRAHVLFSLSFPKVILQFSSVSQSCPNLCDPMDYNTPNFPIRHQLPELTQTQVHRVGNAIQPFHPLSSPSPPTFNLSWHLNQRVSSSHHVAKVLEFQLQHQSFRFIFRKYFFTMDWLDLLAVQGTLKSLLQHHSSKASIALRFLYSPTLTSIHDYRQNHSFD